MKYQLNDHLSAKENTINSKADIKRFIEKLEYARNLLENSSDGVQANNAIIGTANVLEGYEIGEQFRSLCEYTKMSNNEEEIIRLCQHLNEVLLETIASLEDLNTQPNKKWWEFWKHESF